MQYRNLQNIQADINKGAISVESLVQYYLENIKKQEHLNIYLEVYETEALEQARELDLKLKTSPDTLGRLFGMVVSVKDVISHKGHGLTAGSKILSGFEAVYSATAIERIVKEDAIIIGRVNCDEFAMGSSNDNPHYGPTRNADNPDLIPGGSSGGSAVSVQANTCLASLGSDTGGSVRQPAGFCGVVGLKPSYGRISRYGLIAYGSSFDQIGTLTHCVDDAALLLEIMAGDDGKDASMSQVAVPPYSQIANTNKKAKIAYLDAVLKYEGIDPHIKEASLNYIEKLKAAGHTVEPVHFELLEYLVPAYYVLTTAEASSNLSRFDGVRYGYRSEGSHSLDEVYKKSRTEGFGREVKKRIMLGTFVLSVGYYDAYYSKAQKIRRLLLDETQKILSEYDFIFMPVSPVAPWPVGYKPDNPNALYLADIYTVHANLAGTPAIALPSGEKHPNGTSIGIQFMGKSFGEHELIDFAKQLKI